MTPETTPLSPLSHNEMGRVPRCPISTPPTHCSTLSHKPLGHPLTCTNTSQPRCPTPTRPGTPNPNTFPQVRACPTLSPTT
jgi:hypothetical protein